MSVKNILIGGGSGFIGRHLTKLLTQQHGARVTIISRTSTPNTITWDQLEEKGLNSNVDAVINLAGQNVLNPVRPWNNQYQRDVINSRVDTTRRLANLINSSKTPPRVFLTISGVGVYPFDDDNVLYDEHSSCSTFDFFSHLVHLWEAASRVKPNKCRVVNVRSGVVLGPDGGIIKQMYLPFLLGGGAKLASGKQLMPWIHVHDLAEIFVAAIHNDRFEGVINGVAPQLVTNAEFTREFARALHRPALFRIPEFALKLIFGPVRAPMITKGQRVASVRMQELVFQPRHPTIGQALSDILKKQ